MKLSITSIIVCFFFSYAAQVIAKGSSKPNILIIYADDLGYGDLAIQNPDSEIPTSHNLGDTEQGMSKGDWTNQPVAWTISSPTCLFFRFGLN